MGGLALPFGDMYQCKNYRTVRRRSFHWTLQATLKYTNPLNNMFGGHPKLYVVLENSTIFTDRLGDSVLWQLGLYKVASQYDLFQFKKKKAIFQVASNGNSLALTSGYKLASSSQSLFVFSPVTVPVFTGAKLQSCPATGHIQEFSLGSICKPFVNVWQSLKNVI